MLNQKLKLELASALNLQIELLKDVESIEIASIDALILITKSLGFMLENAPETLLSDCSEDLYFMMFQYYNLVEELKHNLKMTYPYARLHNKTLFEIIDQFPVAYKKEINEWWEQKTGLTVVPTKQTIIMD